MGPTWQGDEPSSESAELLLSLTAVWFEAESEQKCIDPFEREQPVAVLDSNKDPTKKELPIEGMMDIGYTIKPYFTNLCLCWLALFKETFYSAIIM